MANEWMKKALMAAGRSDEADFGLAPMAEVLKNQQYDMQAKQGIGTLKGKPVGNWQPDEIDPHKLIPPRIVRESPNNAFEPRIMVYRPDGSSFTITKVDAARLGMHNYRYLGNGQWRDERNGQPMTKEQVYKAHVAVYESAKNTAANIRYQERKKGRLFNKIGSAIDDVADAIVSVPVIGPALEVTYNAAVGSVAMPIQVASNIAKGKRIDKAVYEPFKERVKEVQAVAPYVQTVVSFVPGIGTGVAAAIGAANALTKGQPITDALLEGAKGAIPGGPIAQAAFEVGVAAVQGKPIDEIVLSAIPLPAAQKDLVIKGAKAAKDIANGKNVAESIYLQGKSFLPKEAQAGLDAGIAIAQGKKLQDIARAATPAAIPQLAKLGDARIGASSVFQAGNDLLKSNPNLKKGYSVGLGFMSHKITPTAMLSLRKSLGPQEKKGFDIAVSTHIGSVAKPQSKTITPKARFGYYVTQGMRGAKPARKTSMMKTLTKDLEVRKGAAKAVTEVQKVKTKAHEQGFFAWWGKFFKKLVS